MVGAEIVSKNEYNQLLESCVFFNPFTLALLGRLYTSYRCKILMPFSLTQTLSNQSSPCKTWNCGLEKLLIWAMTCKPRNQNSVILIQIVTTIIHGLKRIRTYHWIKNVFKFSLFRVLGTVNNKNINYNINTVSVLAKHSIRNKRKGCKFCNCCCLQLFY